MKRDLQAEKTYHHVQYKFKLLQLIFFSLKIFYFFSVAAVCISKLSKEILFKKISQNTYVKF
jgi:hypothetical protein